LSSRIDNAGSGQDLSFNDIWLNGKVEIPILSDLRLGNHIANLSDFFDLLGWVQEDTLLNFTHSFEVFSDVGGDTNHST
jgi:hypothetical protein